MKYLIAFILAIVLVAAEGKVVLASDIEKQQTGTEPPEKSIEDQITEFRNDISNLTTQLQQQFNLSTYDQDEIEKTFMEHSADLANQVNELLKNMTKIVAASDVENQQTSTQSLGKSIDDQISEETQNVIDNLTIQLQKQFNLSTYDQDEIEKTFMEHKADLANKVNEFLKNVTEEVKTKSPELENFWTNLKTKMSETINTLNVNPETSSSSNIECYSDARKYGRCNQLI